MKITYVGTFRAEICLDGDMVYKGMSNDYHPLQDYIDKVIYFYLMGEYNFSFAQIVDCDTGEIIVEMDNYAD